MRGNPPFDKLVLRRPVDIWHHKLIRITLGFIGNNTEIIDGMEAEGIDESLKLDPQISKICIVPN